MRSVCARWEAQRTNPSSHRYRNRTSQTPASQLFGPHHQAGAQQIFKQAALSQVAEQEKRVVENSQKPPVGIPSLSKSKSLPFRRSQSRVAQPGFSQSHRKFRCPDCETENCAPNRSPRRCRSARHRRYRRRRLHTLANIASDSRCLRHIGKCAVVVVVEELTRQAG